MSEERHGLGKVTTVKAHGQECYCGGKMKLYDDRGQQVVRAGDQFVCGSCGIVVSGDTLENRSFAFVAPFTPG